MCVLWHGRPPELRLCMSQSVVNGGRRAEITAYQLVGPLRCRVRTHACAWAAICATPSHTFTMALPCCGSNNIRCTWRPGGSIPSLTHEEAGGGRATTTQRRLLAGMRPHSRAKVTHKQQGARRQKLATPGTSYFCRESKGWHRPGGASSSNVPSHTMPNKLCWQPLGKRRPRPLRTGYPQHAWQQRIGVLAASTGCAQRCAASLA